MIKTDGKTIETNILFSPIVVVAEIRESSKYKTKYRITVHGCDQNRIDEICSSIDDKHTYAL